MSEVKTLLRFCPACGKRFHIQLVGKKLLDERMETTEVKMDRGVIGFGMAYGGNAPVQYVSVEENVPVTVDVEDFQYSYKCVHCGHAWTEMHEVDRKVGTS